MYSQITANKRKTWLLIAIACAVIVVLSVAFGAAYNVDAGSSVVIGTIFASIYSLFSYYFSDKIALSVNGAKQIEKKDAPEIWNIVENLCIADGVPMPKIYIMDDAAPNAFATGRDPQHASIAFTTGLLSILDKQELEGVTSHELSHIKNYDLRVMTIVVVLVGAIMIMSNIFLHSRFSGGGRKNDALVAFVLVGIVLSILSPIFAQLIQLAVSRQREYLADASGALLTRFPEGLASALEKISRANVPMQNANKATAHLFIANPFGNKVAGWFSTHPPVEERIKRLREMGG
ncbi:MAG: M48 family metallopeptidase [Patescibacteria group bacterium]|jgi:heat shock protein HtpX